MRTYRSLGTQRWTTHEFDRFVQSFNTLHLFSQITLKQARIQEFQSTQSIKSVKREWTGTFVTSSLAVTIMQTFWRRKVFICFRRLIRTLQSQTILSNQFADHIKTSKQRYILRSSRSKSNSRIKQWQSSTVHSVRPLSFQAAPCFGRIYDFAGAQNVVWQFYTIRSLLIIRCSACGATGLVLIEFQNPQRISLHTFRQQTTQKLVSHLIWSW